MKRLSLILASALIVTSVLSGCGGAKTASETAAGTTAAAGETQASTAAPASTEAVKLTYWNPFTGDDGKFMAKIVDNFNKENGGKIEVSIQTMVSDDYYAKIPVAVNSGTGVPDLAICHVDRIPYFVSKGMMNPMDDEISKMGLKAEDFIPSTWNAGIQKDGKRYSLPLDTHPFVMFYNKTMLKNLGYTEDDLKDLKKDKFMEMCKKATTGSNFGVGFIYGWMTPVFFSFLSQEGGKLVSGDDPSKALFNSAEGVKAMQDVMDIINAGVANKAGSDHVAQFKQGKSLFCVDGIWSSSGMDAQKGLDWGEMFLPQFGAKGGEWANSHNLVEFKQSKVDQAKVDATRTLIKYLSDNSLEWAKGGQVPARISVLQSQDFRTLKWGFAADKLDWFSYPDAVVTAGNMSDALGPVLTDISSGKEKDIQAGLDKAAKAAEAKAAQTLAN